MSWLIDDAITHALLDVPGVARVARDGGALREIRVELDPQRLQALGVTAAEISAQLGQTLLDESSGRSEIGAQEQSLRLLSRIDDMAELAALDLALPGGGRVTLGDLASVRDAEAEIRSVAFHNGDPVTAFSVFLAPGHSAPVVARQVADVLAAFAERQDDLSILLVDSSIPELEADFASAMDTLVEGAILAVIVVYLFLRDIRATIIAALAIPLSVLPTFWVLSLLGFSLNTISLLAVTLVTGVLVDDAIVEIENIVRHMRSGKSA